MGYEMFLPCSVLCIFLPGTNMSHILLHSFLQLLYLGVLAVLLPLRSVPWFCPGVPLDRISPSNMFVPSQSSSSLHHIQWLNSTSICHLFTPHMIQQWHPSDVPEQLPFAARQHSLQFVCHRPSFRAIDHCRSNARIVYSCSAHDWHAPVH